MGCLSDRAHDVFRIDINLCQVSNPYSTRCRESEIALLAKWGRCGQVLVESLQWAWECVILWEVLQIRPTKYGRLSKNTLCRETSYASSWPSQKPSNKSFSSCLPKFWCRMWKLETPKSWIDGIWLESKDEIGTFLGSNLLWIQFLLQGFWFCFWIVKVQLS